MPLRSDLRLQVLNALPKQHRDYFFAKVRMMCKRFIGSAGLPMSDRDSESVDLFSEVMAKLLGAAPRRDVQDGDDTSNAQRLSEGGAPSSSSFPETWSIDAQRPERDGRVLWLIEEIGGTRALSHRYEDMRRQRWGRWQDSGYRTMQISALQSAQDYGLIDEDALLSRAVDSGVASEPDHEEAHQSDEVRLAWRGLLVCALAQFHLGDDVPALLKVLAEDPDVQASFGSEWPVRQIAHALNALTAAEATAKAAVWDDRRVDNAKKRLRNWIGRLKRDCGLETTDLVALFVRCAREQTAAPMGVFVGQGAKTSAEQAKGEHHG